MGAEDFISMDDVRRMMRDTEDDQSFRRLYQGEWSNLTNRCEHKSVHHQCPNKAVFRIIIGDSDKSSLVCDRCLVPVLMGTRSNVAVVVTRI